MKPKIISAILATTILILSIASCGDTPTNSSTTSTGVETFDIVTSINPIHIITQNITKDAQNITVTNMTAGVSGGGHHDYTLTNKDMKLLTDADMFIINGAGTEGYLDNIKTNFPLLEIVDSSASVQLIKNDELYDSNDETGNLNIQPLHTEDDAYNNHIWMSPNNAAIQAKNITTALKTSNPENSDAYSNNYDAFYQELAEIDAEYRSFLDSAPNKNVVLTHDSLFYLANDYNITISSLISNEPDVAPSAKVIEKTKDIMEEENIEFIVIEPDSPRDIADTIAFETGATVEVIDSMLNSASTPETYKATMMNNLDIFKKYFV